MKKKIKEKIGFPKPLLGDKNVRIEVIQNYIEWISLNKPAGVYVRQHPWNNQSEDLDRALNIQLEEGKPEILKCNANLFGSIYSLDPEISGVCLFGKTKGSITELRNHFGSNSMNFTFIFIARFENYENINWQNNTPIIGHHNQRKMVPSKINGKKCMTNFKCINIKNDWILCEAKTNYLRPHQIRLHAYLSGMKILGETIYAKQDSPTYADLGMTKKIGDKKSKIFDGIALHLEELAFDEFSLQAPLTKEFKNTLNYLNL